MALRGGSGSRQRAKIRRKKERQSLKAQNQAFYDSIKGTPANIKRTARISRRKFNPNKHIHLVAKCGNLACYKNGKNGCIIIRSTI